MKMVEDGKSRTSRARPERSGPDVHALSPSADIPICTMAPTMHAWSLSMEDRERVIKACIEGASCARSTPAPAETRQGSQANGVQPVLEVPRGRGAVDH
jgi:hypothetical protein